MAKRVTVPGAKVVLAAERARRAKPPVPVPSGSPEKTVKIRAKPLRPSVSDEAASNDLQAIFGENLKAARIRNALKQSDVADRTGWTQQRLSLIEAGKQNLTLKTMMKLAQAVNDDVVAMLQPAQTGKTKKKSGI